MTDSISFSLDDSTRQRIEASSGQTPSELTLEGSTGSSEQGVLDGGAFCPSWCLLTDGEA